MTRRRSRCRRRGSSGGPATAVVLAVALLAVVAFGVTDYRSAAFTTASTPRGVATDVTVDESGIHALDTAGSVHVNATDPLVNVTNRLGRDATISVALATGSREMGDLVVDGTVEGNRTTFTLSEGATRTVEIEVPDDGSLVGETIQFHVNASATGLDVSATDRTVTVEG